MTQTMDEVFNGMNDWWDETEANTGGGSSFRVPAGVKVKGNFRLTYTRKTFNFSDGPKDGLLLMYKPIDPIQTTDLDGNAVTLDESTTIFSDRFIPSDSPEGKPEGVQKAIASTRRRWKSNILTTLGDGYDGLTGDDLMREFLNLLDNEEVVVDANLVGSENKKKPEYPYLNDYVNRRIA